MFYGDGIYRALGPVGLTLVTPPEGEPLTLSQAKNHLRIDADIPDDDALITALISAAREYVEMYCNRALITQSWTMTMDDFPRPHFVGAWRPREFHVPKPKLQSIESIKYIANDGTLTTVDPTTYVVDTASLQGRVALAYGQYWPCVLHQANAVTVAFTCGYGDATTIPKGILQAMLLLIGHLYENRESVVVVSTRSAISEVPFTVETLLSAYRVVEF